MTAAEFAPVFRAFVGANDRFILCGHIRPDGDSIGSCTAMAGLLKSLGKTAEIYYEGDISHYDMIPQPVEMLDPTTIKAACQRPFAWILLDCAQPARTGQGQICAEYCKASICIDHHVNMGEYAEHNWIDPQATSASEMLFRLFKAAGYPIHREQATSLFAGIAFDTGGFRHSSMTPEIYTIAGELSGYGVAITDVMNGLFHTKSMIEQKVLGVILRKAKLYRGCIIVSEVDQADLRQAGGTSDDCEGAVAVLAETREAEASVFLRELSNGQIRVNMRSKQYIDVAEAARAFGGGGHVRAAGCTLDGPMLMAKQQVLTELYKQLREEP
ncbi:MAG: bifunctional oligoribonuclease/PAP phosphatase NrnA [Firmicutes bacterium]|nr:bifunctional oligoribonuclease/PAP phosphatase NrnA [Bacillota bacterium]